MSLERFPIRIGRRSRPVLFFFGVKADGSNAWVELTDDAVAARFGWSSFRTPVTNVARWRIEGPWLWITAIGFRRSNRHRDITYGGSPHGGVRLDFHEPPRLGVFRPPAVYLTVDDLDAFAAALAGRGIPGEDGRKRIVP